MGASLKLNGKLKNRAAKVARALFSNHNQVMIHFTGFDGVTHIMNHKDHKLYECGPLQAWHLENSSFKWQIYVAVIGVDQLGQKFVRDEPVPCKDFYTYEQLVDYLNEVAEKLINSLNSNHVKGVGYIAAPYRLELTDKKVFRMFESYGVFKK